MAIKPVTPLATRQKDYVLKRGTSQTGKSDYDVSERIAKLEKTIHVLNKRIQALEGKIKVMKMVTRDRNGRETIIVKG